MTIGHHGRGYKWHQMHFLIWSFSIVTNKSDNVRRARGVVLGYLKNSNIGCDEAIAIHNPKSYAESKMQKGQCFLPSRGVPPSQSQKC